MRVDVLALLTVCLRVDVLADRDECSEDATLCVNGTSNLPGSGLMYVQGTCEDRIGGFECVCERGYIWNDTLMVCMGTSSPPGL